MKNLLLLLVLSLLLIPIVSAQTGCPNNIASNGDLSLGTPGTGHQDIDDAVDFSRIWATGSFAEFYGPTMGPYTPPSPATGNYASCWIANYVGGGTNYREGFKSRLATAIAANSGMYDLTFDVACLGGWGAPEIAVYGVFNPTGNPCPAPSNAYTPSNLNLYGTANTVLLGIIPVGNTCSNVKNNFTLTFNSNATGFPASGMTHFFITHSDNSSISGARYMGFDNFCIQSVPCPEIIQDTLTTCIGDVNGDGFNDYTIQITSINPGDMNLSVTCGSVSPTTISSPGTYTLTVLSGGACGPSQIDYTSFDVSLNSCGAGSIFLLSVNNCPVDSCGLINNWNLESGTPTTGDQDIDNATDFSKIWSGGSWAEFYGPTMGPYTPPTPATGNYASCWIANYTNGGTIYREGFKSELTNSISANSGAYSMTFDMACLGGWGTPEVAVYGVFNPTGNPCPSPSGAYTPSNLNLYGAGTTVLLGTITVGSPCSNTKVNQTITFNSNAAGFPVNGMTHFFITHSDNSSINGARYMAFDNFCMQSVPCPELISETPLTCINDVNGDGINDYTIDITTINLGTMNFSIPCGSISPSSISGPGTHTLTILSGGMCSPAKFDYYSIINGQDTCSTGEVRILFPNDCPPDTCGFVSNWDLESGTPTTGDQDIDNATDFSKIWSGGSWAEFYGPTMGPYTPPTPATGNYASCWIANYTNGGTTYREGFKSELTNPIPANSGAYSMTFDMACLGGWGTPEVAVYGVFNPTGNPCPSPSGAYTPSNLNLYGAGTTVLLGTITVGSPCSNTKVNQTITFNSNAAGFPTNGMTHFFITHSDNSSISGARYMAFDNFCMQSVPPCPEVIDTRVDCAKDINGDGIPDYTVQLLVNNSGSINLSTSCGSVIPSTLSNVSNGWYTVMIVSNGTCNPFVLNYQSLDSNGDPCNNSTLQLILPPCKEEGCLCGEEFIQEVEAGFTRLIGCPNDIFTPSKLRSCDRVEWSIDGVVVGTTIGNASFSRPHQSGIYRICMTVYRTQANGEICSHRICYTIKSKLECIGIGIGFGTPANFKIAPNPANNTLNVSWGTERIPEELSIGIFSSNGIEVQRIERVNGHEGSLRIDIQKLTSGLYFIKMEGENYAPTPIKFIKKN